MKKLKKWFDSAIIKEDESKTASNERHFVLNNGTRKAVFSPSLMNYFDEEEKVWKPIDNSLKKTGDGYVARLGKYTATLSKKDENESVEVRSGDDLISWEYLGNNAETIYSGSEKGRSSSAVKRQSKLNVKTKIRDSFDLSSASRAVFANAEGDVDLDYSIEGNGVKENILIKEKSDSYHYYFRLRVAGFEMRTATDGVGLEFYKTGMDPEQAEAQTPEFVMPAPFMYDANGERSDDVRFSVERIEDGVYLFSVEASSEWINAEERVFPVCIDPQLQPAVFTYGISVLNDHYHWVESGGSGCEEDNWVCVERLTNNYILLSYTEHSEKTSATLHIPKSRIGIDNSKVQSVILKFPPHNGQNHTTNPSIWIEGTVFSYTDGNNFFVGITGLYKNAADDIDIKMEMYTPGGVSEFGLPTMEISYVTNAEPIRKTLSVGKGVNMEFDVLSGNETVVIDDIEDPVLGVSVAHVFKPNDEIVEYGKDYRLNLDEKMVRTNTSPTGVHYAYTDALGDVHMFDEHFYRINADGEKEEITSGIELITADADGRLWKNGTEVFRELTTVNGLRASARLEDSVENADLVEQRVDEEKQVEEQVKSYCDMLCNFVSIDKDTGVQQSMFGAKELNSPDSFKDFLNTINTNISRLLLSKEEALAYKSLLTQRTTLDNLVPTPNNLDDQQADITDQLELYKSKSAKYREQISTYYKEYLNLKNRFDTLKMQIPVAYLISDDTIKGFNADGNLVVVQDKHGNYVVIEREKYDSSGKDRIVSVYNQDGKTMRFFYNGNNKLSEICNSLGERVRFKYNGYNHLTDIERDKLPSLKLTYAAEHLVSKIESSDQTRVLLQHYSSGLLKKISYATSERDIEHDDVASGSFILASEMDVEYTATEIKLIYSNGKQEIYEITKQNDDTEVQVTAYYELVNGVVTKAEHYEYDENGMLRKAEYADESCLQRYLYEEFAANEQIGTIEETTYNSFKEPTLIVSSKYDVPCCDCNCPSEQTSVEYIYNDDHKLIEKRTTHCYGCCAETNDATVAVVKYFYDNAGEVVRTESYVEGEELKTGVTVEEHFFNDQGVEIRSTTYNSLDPSSKFYTEYEVDDKGLILSAFDETGEHKTAFDYERDGVTVRTKRYPNGSKFSYGRDKDGTAVAITQSTESGEENSTKQVRTLDVVTEIKSGNNTVRYAYDWKRRVKSVSLNGVDDYVTYQYTKDPTTHEETVRATLKDGTVAVCTRDMFGNIVRVVTEKYNEEDPSQIDSGYSVVYSENGDQKTVADTVKKQDEPDQVTTVTHTKNGNQTTIVSDPGLTETLVYDEQDNSLTGKTISGTNVSQTYAYHRKQTSDKGLERIVVNSLTTIRPKTDVLGRNIGKTVEFPNHKTLEETVSYVKFGDHATNLPSSIRFGFENVVDSTLQYKYDAMGNIVEILENDVTISRYEYDALGRLTREDNTAFGKTTTWAYDNNGNILVKKEYDVTAKPTKELRLLSPLACKLYTYKNNSDQLTSYGNDTFHYDEIGNPDIYRGTTARWDKGRQLIELGNHSFSYDARGRRTKKNDITFTYDSDGNLIRQSDGVQTLVFLYDHTGVFAVKYDNATYYYRKDAQGNVIALLDNTGAIVVKYAYNAWGNCKAWDANNDEITAATHATHIGYLNPFRYRGYYYDVETGLYFLKTRYYDPEIGRFITIDDISYLDPDSINGLNLYAYCGNNPVNSADYNGTFVLSTFLITIAIGALIGGAISGGFEIVHQVRMYGWDTDSWDWKQIGLSTLGGVVAGAISAIPIPGFQGFGGFILHYGLTFATGAIGAVAGGMISGSVKPDALSIFKAVLIGGFANVIANGLSDYFKYSKASKIFNQSRKAKSLLVQELQGHPLNMGPKAFKGRYVNAFKDTTLKEIEDLIENANSLFRYGVFSSIFSSLLSGWY